MNSPLVSVVLPVYNGAAYLASAVDCILKQTFADFELIVINDGSTDASAALLAEIHDPRVIVVHQKNAGLAASLNRAIEMARGPYIARQDQDDISMPTRLACQFEFMETHPKCALLGTRAEIWVGDQKTERAHDHPVEDASLRFELLFNNPFVHSSVMLRKSSLDEVGLYATDSARQPPEDYELWSRIARHAMIANLPERMTIYREVPKSMSRVGRNPFLEKLVVISSENIAAILGLTGPSSVTGDIAAMTHSAYDCLSAKPDLKSMCDYVYKAGLRIHAGSGESDVLQRAEFRVKCLRHQYLAYRYKADWLRPFVRFTRTMKMRIKKYANYEAK